MVYQYNTSNVSFLKMFKELKDMGIQNNKFFLALYDSKLLDVDPHDPNLSLEMQVRILKECRINVWYYLREVIRIPVPGGHTPYLLHRGNLAQTFCMNLNLNIIEILPRQHGKTIGAVSYYSWVYNYSTKNSNIVFSNKELGDSQLNIKRLTDIMELLPEYLKPHLNSKVDTNNVNLIRCIENNNTIKALSTAKDKPNADKLGRGLTIPVCWFDEFAFLKFNDTIYESASPALTKASEEAQKRGAPYGKLITTTPNDLDSKEGKFCHKILTDALWFDETWYDWDADKIREHVLEHSKNKFIRIEFTYKELGRDEKWLKEQIADLFGNMLKVKRELLLEWTYANNVSPFSEEQLSMIEQYVKEPLAKFFINEVYRFDIIEDMKNLRNKSWIVSVDVAAGLSEDSSAITVIDPATLKPVCEFNSNTIGTTDLSIVIIHLIENYLPSAVVVVERNNAGIAVIDLLLRSSIASNLYYETKKEKGQKKITDPKKKSTNSGTETRVYGINTLKNSRDIMINEILFMMINERTDSLISKKIFAEIRSLIRTKRGKIEHGAGFHDDSLMSYLIGLYALIYGTNMNKFLKEISDRTFDTGNADKTMVNRIKNLSSPYENYTDFSTSQRIIDDFLDPKNPMNPANNPDNRNAKRIRMINFIIGG